LGTSSRDHLATALRREIERDWPRLTYHYGIPPSELATTPRWLRQIYVEALPELIGTTQLQRVAASSYPHLEEDSRRSYMRRLSRLVPTASSEENVAKPKSLEEAQKMYASVGIGFEVVPAGKNE
jgi:hypothetical protein